MAIRKADAIWEGTLREGAGRMRYGTYDGRYTYSSRFEEGEGTNPEELIGAAHAGCFSMFLSAQLTAAGFPPTSIHTSASVHLERDEVGPKITLIVLETAAEVPGVDEATFQEKVAASKQNCPISRALAATEMRVVARLV